MNLDLNKILKSAEFVFEDEKMAIQAIDYIRVLVDQFYEKNKPQNALVQILAPDTVNISERDLARLKSDSEKYNDLKVSFDALSKNYDELADKETVTYNEMLKWKNVSDSYLQSINDMAMEANRYKELAAIFDESLKAEKQRYDELSKEVEHLRKSRGMCQLDSSGTCTYCDKRVILASSLSTWPGIKINE